MQGKSLRFLFATLLGAVSLFAQQTDKPRISTLTVVPSEPIQPTGNCKSNTGGYLNKDGRTALTNSEIGQFVSDKLHDGYILTVYPATKNGIFVSAGCTNLISGP